MPEEKKNLFDKAIDALTDRDEKEAEAKARAEAEAARKKGAEIRAKMEAEAKEAAAERASATKAAADKAIAAKAAADKAAADRATSMKAAATQRAAAAAPKKGVVNVRSLHIRKDHSTTSAEVGGLTHGEEVTILETWSDGKNTWAKLDIDRWAAIEYNGDTLIKLS